MKWLTEMPTLCCWWFAKNSNDELYQCMLLMEIKIPNKAMKFFLNVFTEFTEFSDKNISHYSKTACLLLCKRPGCYHSTRSLNWAQLMVLWFIRFPQFTEFSEFNEGGGEITWFDFCAHLDVTLSRNSIRSKVFYLSFKIQSCPRVCMISLLTEKVQHLQIDLLITLFSISSNVSQACKCIKNLGRKWQEAKNNYICYSVLN